MTFDSDQGDINRTRTHSPRIDRELRERSPATASGDLNERRLRPKVFDISRRTGARRHLEERDELLADGGGNERPCLYCRARTESAFELTDAGLRDARIVRDIDLAEAGRQPSVAEGDPKPRGDGIGAATPARDLRTGS